MAIVGMDNWAIYGGNVANLLNGVYAEVGGGGVLVPDPDGVSSGWVFRHGNPGFGNLYVAGLRYVLPSAQSIAGVAQRIWRAALPTTGIAFPILVSFRNGSNGNIAWLGMSTTGGLFLFSEASGVTYSTTGPVVSANAWWHIETKINVATGAYEVRVEGVPVLSGTGANFGASNVAQVALATMENFADQSAGNTWHKDLIFWDGTTAQNNDFLGSCIVYSMLPDGDIAVPWTKVGGATGFGILDTAPPNDAGVYLDAVYPPPAAVEVTLGNLPPTVTSVKTIMTQVRAKKVDGGDGQLQTSMISGASTANGVDRPITAASTYWRDFFPQDPVTSAAWTVAAANAAHMKINRTV